MEINKGFVDFSLAVKLREKGFREECFARYHYNDKAYFERNSYHPDTESIFYCYNNDEDLSRFYTDAPTISQVLKWLRNTYNLHVETYPCGLGMWKFLVTNITTLEERALCDKYTSSEQADLAGIEYVLDNLI